MAGSLSPEAQTAQDAFRFKILGIDMPIKNRYWASGPEEKEFVQCKLYQSNERQE
jgi:hypothetical protein